MKEHGQEARNCSENSPRRVARGYRHRSLGSRFAILAVGVLSLLGVSSGVASAGPEHHNGDPLGTGCANSLTKTIKTASVGSITYEIRYSPTCGTNWVRIPKLHGTVYMLIRSDWGGQAQGGYQTGSGGSHWTPQVYAPGATCITYWVQQIGGGDPATGNVRLC